MILTKQKIDGINLSELVSSKLKKNSINSLLLVVPTNRKLRSLKKYLISSAAGETATQINIETIGTLTGKLLSEYSSYIPLSDAAASVLLKQSISDSRLQYFSGYEEEIPAGTLDRIRRVISEYKRSGITPEDLLKESQKLTGSEKTKAEDIAEIYKHFRKKSGDLGAKETGDIYYEINQIASEEFNYTFAKLFPGVDLVIIDGFNEFTEPEIRIIDKLSCTGRELYMNFDYYGGNPLIFSHLDKSYNSLLLQGFRAIRDLSKEVQSSFRTNIRSNLFNPVREKLSGFKELISVIPALNREKEIDYITKEIKILITEKNVQPHRICLAFNLIDKYSPILRDTFSNSGIPFNLTDRLSLAKASPVITILNYLEIIENDFYYKNLFRALSNEPLRINKVDLAGLIKVSVKQKIISGYHNWITSISGVIEELKYYTGEDVISAEKDLSLYRKALKDIESINDFLNPFTSKQTLREFIINLKSLINQLGLPLNLITIDGKEEESIKSVTVFLETISEVFRLLELEYGTLEKFTLSFFLDQIRTAVLSTRFNIKEKSNYGVLITTFNEIRGLDFDYLFLGGLCDGDFPTKYNPEIFFSGSYIRNELIHQTEERYNFYQVLCSWEKGLYLSYPFQDKDKELTVSNFLKDFTALFDITGLSASSFESLIHSKNEMLEKITVKDESLFRVWGFDMKTLGSAIEIDRLRISDPFGLSIFTGNVSNQSDQFNLSKAASEKLKQLGEKEFSITQLEKYAACPYQYFLERILFLNIIEEPSEEFEAFELGTLIHSILYEFYNEVTQRSLQLQHCSDAQFSKAVEIMFSIAEKKVEETSSGSILSFYDKESILGINGERRNSVLYKFLETERISPEDFIPILFEQSFNELIPDNNGPVKVRGKIDRIEINHEEKTFHTIDYKLSGKKPSGDDLTNGISLQLPLYMYAASRLLQAEFNHEFLPADAVIYSLKYKTDRFGRQSILLKGRTSYENLDENEKQDLIKKNQDIINTCIEMIIRFTRSIKEGHFHLSTLADRQNKVCRFCNFNSICRIQEVT